MMLLEMYIRYGNRSFRISLSRTLFARLTPIDAMTLEALNDGVPPTQRALLDACILGSMFSAWQ